MSKKVKYEEPKEAVLTVSAIGSQVIHLLGEILTIIDASIQDKQQNKAVKDLIKSTTYDKLDWIRKLATGNFGLVGMGENGEIIDIPELRGAVGISEEDIIKE